MDNYSSSSTNITANNVFDINRLGVSNDFEAGKSVFIKTEDEQLALPVGEYELEGDRVLVVSV